MRGFKARLVLVTSLYFLLILFPCTAPPQRSLSVNYGNGTISFRSMWFPHLDYTVEKPNCFYYSLKLLWLAEILSFGIDVTNMFTKSGNRSANCRFNFDQYHRALDEVPHLLNLTDSENTAWFCDLDPNLVCDGKTQCLWDECSCQTNLADVFYCFDGSGCVLFDRLCDGTQDCIDGSDEGYCAGYARVSCPLISSTDIFLPTLPSIEKSCFELNYMSRHYNCSFVDNHEAEKCTEHDMIENFEVFDNPLYSCLVVNAPENRYMVWDTYSAGCMISSYCKNNCTHEKNFVADGWTRNCDNLFCHYGHFMTSMIHTIFFCARHSWGTFEAQLRHSSGTKLKILASRAQCVPQLYPI